MIGTNESTNSHKFYFIHTLLEIKELDYKMYLINEDIWSSKKDLINYELNKLCMFKDE